MTARKPPGWTTARLEDIVAAGAPIIYGILQPGPEVANGVPYVRPTEIQGGTIQLSAVRRTSCAIAARYSRASLQAGDLLLSIVGTIGKTAIVPPALEGGNITQSSVRIRPGGGAVVEYLRSLLASPQMVQRYDAARLGTGVPRLNVAHVRELDCPVPPLAEQRRIVAKLDRLQVRSQRARIALDTVPALLEQLRRSILAAAFRGDLTADWRAKHPDVEPASALLARIRTERREHPIRAAERYVDPAPPSIAGLPSIPSTWVWTTFETIARVDLGRQRAPQYQTGLHSRPYLRVANIKDDRIDFSDVFEMDFDPEDYAHYHLRAGDILLSEGQSPERVGQSAVYDGSVDGLCFQKTLHRFRSYPSGPSAAFAQLLVRHYVRSGVFRSIASLTVNIAHLTLVRLKPLRFPLPPAEEQVEIVRRASTAMDRLRSLETQAELIDNGLDHVGRSILAKAFRGELVPQDPTDEPAADMLARLRAATARDDSGELSTKVSSKKRRVRE